ncbi:MAG: CsbD family protein [Polyangiaceae bacterium]
MTWTQIKGHWKELRGEARSTWGDLTDDDLLAADGEAELLIGRVMARYGVSKESAEQQVEAWIARLEEQLIAAEMSNEIETEARDDGEGGSTDDAPPSK